ncbi:MAG: HD domain-containing protein [Brevinemataceae bacterium]
MIRKSLLVKLFDGFFMQRWNDQLRPTPMVEADKQAHSICLAYFLGRMLSQEERFDMNELIEKSIFRYLERIVVTDIKPPVFHRITQDEVQYRSLKKFVKESWKPYFEGLPEEFVSKFFAWCDNESKESTLVDQVMVIARSDATLWEFDLLKNANPNGFGISEIEADMQLIKNKHIELRRHLQIKLDTKHIREERKSDLFSDETYSSYSQLVKMFGQMRFQIRWAQLHREPKTSVLGHSFYVAVLCYFLTLLAGGSKKRIYNNFFAGLFHDLPELFTRDIISPLKTNILGLGDLLKKIEDEEMDKKFKMLIPEILHEELFYFINDEFGDYIIDKGKSVACPNGIDKCYNEDSFNPKDGSIVRLADHISAFLEADIALKNGAASMDFVNAKERIAETYSKKRIAGLDLQPLFLDFR